MIEFSRGNYEQKSRQILEATRGLSSTNAEGTHLIECLRSRLKDVTEEMERLRRERDEVRESYCSLMEAYRGGDGRVTANKLGWGYLFPRRPKKEDGK